MVLAEEAADGQQRGPHQTAGAGGGIVHCRYQGERVNFAAAEALCAANGLEQGYGESFNRNSPTIARLIISPTRSTRIYT